MRNRRRISVLLCLTLVVLSLHGTAFALGTVHTEAPVDRSAAVGRITGGRVPATSVEGLRPLASTSVELGLIGDYTFDEIYAGRLIGLVYNGANSSVESVTLRMRYFNASGGLIRTDSFSGTSAAMLYVLEPDTVAPFVANLSSLGGPPSGTAGWELTAWGSSCPKWAVWPTAEVTAAQNLVPGMHYSGTITNDTPYVLDEMIVSIIREYEATGYFGDIGGIVLTGPFAPGESKSWDLYTMDSLTPGHQDYLFTEGLKPAATTPASRISGQDRFQTAILASKASFADGAGGTVVLASGLQYADALSASALAGALNAPILLSKTDSLPWAAMFAEELGRLGCTRVVIVGGTGVVTPAVETQLRTILPAGAEVVRIAGADRYGTCAAVLNEIDTVTAGSPPTAAFVVRGDAFADALAVSPYAWSQRMPVVLVKPTSAPTNVVSALNSIGVTKLWVVGGTSAVSNATANSFGLPVQRVAGSNRYATAVEVLLAARDELWSDMGVLGLTSGAAFPDALVAGPSLGSRNGGLLLTPAPGLPSESASGIYTVAEDVNELLVIGGIVAVSNWTYQQAHYLCR